MAEHAFVTFFTTFIDKKRHEMKRITCFKYEDLRKNMPTETEAKSKEFNRKRRRETTHKLFAKRNSCSETETPRKMSYQATLQQRVS